MVSIWYFPLLFRGAIKWERILWAVGDSLTAEHVWHRSRAHLSHRAWRQWALAWCHIPHKADLNIRGFNKTGHSYPVLKKKYSKITNFIFHFLACSPFLFKAVQQEKFVKFKRFKKYLSIIFLYLFWCLQYSLGFVLTLLLWFSVQHLVLLMNVQMAQQSPPPLERRVQLWLRFEHQNYEFLETWGFISSFIHSRVTPGDSWCHCVFCPWCTSDPNPNFGSVPGFFLAIKLCFKVSSSPLMRSVRVFLHACITFVIKALYWLLFHHFIQLWCLPSPFLCTESRALS